MALFAQAALRLSVMASQRHLFLKEYFPGTYSVAAYLSCSFIVEVIQTMITSIFLVRWNPLVRSGIRIMTKHIRLTFLILFVVHSFLFLAWFEVWLWMVLSCNATCISECLIVGIFTWEFLL
jgi:hypothetical protein